MILVYPMIYYIYYFCDYYTTSTRQSVIDPLPWVLFGYVCLSVFGGVGCGGGMSEPWEGGVK